MNDVIQKITVIDRPFLRVDTKHVGYEANNLQFVIQDGRWHLAFTSSGNLVTVPANEVTNVGFGAHGPQHCSTCDAKLTSWPMDDPDYCTVVDAARFATNT